MGRLPRHLKWYGEMRYQCAVAVPRRQRYLHHDSSARMQKNERQIQREQKQSHTQKIHKELAVCFLRK